MSRDGDEPSAVERAEAAMARWLDRLPGRVKVWLSGEPPLTVEGHVLDPQVQLIRAIRRRKRVPPLCTADVGASRARYRRENIVHRGDVPAMRETRELAVGGAATTLAARLHVPHREPAAPALLVWFHGGGFVLGDLETHDAACRILADASGARVLAVAYRLAPEHPFPAAPDDAVASYRWVQGHASMLGVDPARVAVGGDSAGGNLAAVVTWAETRAGRPPLLQLLVYPTTDASRRWPSRDLFGERDLFLTGRDEDEFLRHYVDAIGVPRTDPRVSPLLSGGFAGLPRTLVVTAGFDILRDQGAAYATALREAGVAVTHRTLPSLPHGFLHMSGVSRTARAAIEAIGRALRVAIEEQT